METYKQAELGIQRRLAQRNLIKATKFLKAMTFIYDRAKSGYESSIKAYQLADLRYAEYHNFTICPSKGVQHKEETEVKRKIKTRKIIKSLDSLSLEQLEMLLTQYERK